MQGVRGACQEKCGKVLALFRGAGDLAAPLRTLVSIQGQRRERLQSVRHTHQCIGSGPDEGFG